MKYRQHLAMAVLAVCAVTLSSCAPVTPMLTVVTINRTVPKLEVVHATTTVYVPVEVIKTVIVHDTKYLRTITHEIKTVEVIKEVPTEYKPWESVAHFREWNRINNVGKIPGDVEGDDIDCDDYAERLQILALVQGYAISRHKVRNGCISGVQVRESMRPHMGCIINVDGHDYYTEVYPWNRAVVHIGPVD